MMGMLETYNYEEVQTLFHDSAICDLAFIHVLHHLLHVLVCVWLQHFNAGKYHAFSISTYIESLLIRTSQQTRRLLSPYFDPYPSLSPNKTLLKTTNHILIHDVRGSLDHLCSLVQQGVSPHSRQCVICSRPADCMADGSKDDVIVYRCIRYPCAIHKIYSNLITMQC